LHGPRAVFLIDIMSPCWIFPAADLARGPALQVSVGQVPFNFQIGKARDDIKFPSPQTPSGELDVFLDRCDGQRLAVLSLAPAVGNNAVTTLPAAALPKTAGRHDLCFRFTQRTLDPLWALNSVQFQE
jgi:hexosaminidase